MCTSSGLGQYRKQVVLTYCSKYIKEIALYELDPAEMDLVLTINDLIYDQYAGTMAATAKNICRETCSIFKSCTSSIHDAKWNRPRL